MLWQGPVERITLLSAGLITVVSSLLLYIILSIYHKQILYNINTTIIYAPSLLTTLFVILAIWKNWT